MIASKPIFKWLLFLGLLNRSRDSLSSNSSKTLTKPGPVLSSKCPSMEANISEDDFDDFDPRGSSSGGESS